MSSTCSTKGRWGVLRKPRLCLPLLCFPSLLLPFLFLQCLRFSLALVLSPGL